MLVEDRKTDRQRQANRQIDKAMRARDREKERTNRWKDKNTQTKIKQKTFFLTGSVKRVEALFRTYFETC